MLDRLLRALSELVIRHRALVLIALALSAVGLGLGLRHLTSDPSPEGMVANWQNQQVITQQFKRSFGDRAATLLVLVQAPDVLARGPLAYNARLSHRLEKLAPVSRVDSITVTALPHKSGIKAEEQLPVDSELEKELLGESPGPDAKKPDAKKPDAKKPDEAPMGGIEGRPDLGAATVEPIVDGDTKHFPRGLMSLSARVDDEGLVSAPLVQGDEVGDRELHAVRDTLSHSRLVTRKLLSRDHMLTVIALSLAPALTDFAAQRAAVGRVEQLIHAMPRPDTVHVRLGGLPYLQQSIVHKIQHDQKVLIPATLAVCVVILFLSFRWWPGVILPLSAVGLTTLMLLGGMGWVHQPMNILNNILPTLLIIIGISDSIHLVARYRDEHAKNQDRIESGTITLHSMAAACFLTSLTTSVGFASLAFADTPMLQHFGVIAGIGVLIAYVVTITLLPSTLTLVRPPRVDRTTRAGWLEKMVVGVTARILRRPWPVLVAAGAVFLLFLFGATRLVIDVHLLDQFTPGDDVYETTVLLQRELQGVRPLEVFLQSDNPDRFHDPKVIAGIEKVARWAGRRPGVLATTSYADYLHSVQALLTDDPATWKQPFRTKAQVAALEAVANAGKDKPLQAYLSKDGKRARLTLGFADIGARSTNHDIDLLEHELDAHVRSLGGIRYQLLGEAYTGSRALDAVVTDLLYSLMGATVVIFVILTLLFQSLRLGLLSIPPNVIPIVGTMAYMAARGIALSTATVIIFAISIGLAVDGSIHVVVRFREEARGGLGVNAALLRAARGTGRAIVVTCVTLILGFSVLMMSSFVSVRQFGELIAVTVLSCLFSTLLVQPALLKVGMPRSRASI